MNKVILDKPDMPYRVIQEQLIPKFSIGQTVYRACVRYIKGNAKCPHCSGTNILHGITNNGREFQADCKFCRSYKAKAAPVEEIVSKILITKHYIEYSVNTGVYYREGELFATKAEAMPRSKELAKGINNRNIT